MKTYVVLSIVLAAAVALAGASSAEEPAPPVAGKDKDGLAVATFAAGCFWCVESDFDKVDGVVETISGYTGGHTANPTYGEVGQGGTGHAEAVQLRYDPQQVTYERLLDHYWHNVDLVDGKGQFCDRGDQYRPVIFTHSEEQRRLAEESRARLERSGRFKQPIAVEIRPASAFSPAEDYHQGYYTKNPLKYKFYRYNCGRDRRLAELWGEAGDH
jgi:methionine-S-sulfoxide reductase